MNLTYRDLIMLPSFIEGGRLVFSIDKSKLIYTKKYFYNSSSQNFFNSYRNSIVVGLDCDGYSVCLSNPFVNARDVNNFINPRVDRNSSVSVDTIISFIKNDCEGGSAFLDKSVYDNGVSDSIDEIMTLLGDDDLLNSLYNATNRYSEVSNAIREIMVFLDTLSKVHWGKGSVNNVIDPDDLFIIMVFNDIYLRECQFKKLTKESLSRISRRLVSSYEGVGLFSYSCERMDIALDKAKEIVNKSVLIYSNIKESGVFIKHSGCMFDSFDEIINIYFRTCLSGEPAKDSYVSFSADPVFAKRIVDYMLLKGNTTEPNIKKEIKSMVGFFSGLRDVYPILDEYNLGSLYYNFRKGTYLPIDDDFHVDYMFGINQNDMSIIRQKISKKSNINYKINNLALDNFIFKSFFDNLIRLYPDININEFSPMYDVFKTMNSLSSDRGNSYITAYSNIKTGGVLDFFAGFINECDVDLFGSWVSKNRKYDDDKTSILMTMISSSFFIIYETYRDSIGDKEVRNILHLILEHFISKDVDYGISKSIRIKPYIENKFDKKKISSGIVDFDVDILRRVRLNDSSVSVGWLIRLYKKAVLTGKDINLKKSFYEGFYKTDSYNTLRHYFNGFGSFSFDSVIDYSDRDITTYRLNGAFVNSNKNLLRGFDYLIYDYLNIIANKGTAGEAFIVEEGLFYKNVMVEMSSQYEKSLNPIVFSIYLMYDYLLYADFFGFIKISDKDSYFISDLKSEIELYSIYLREDIIDFGKYMDFNLLFSKYYREIVKSTEKASIGSLPSDISDFYGSKIVRGDFEAKIIKPSILLNRLTSSIISGSNNYLSSHLNKNKSAKRGESIISCSDPLKFSGSYSCSSNVFNIAFRSIEMLKKYFNNFPIDNIDVNNLIRFQQMLGLENGSDFDINAPYIKEKFKTYRDLGSIYGFQRNDTYIKPNPINDIGVLFTYLLSGVSRLDDGFLECILGRGLGNELIMPVEVSQKNSIGDKVKIHYYYLNISFKKDDENNCEKVAFGFSYINRDISYNYSRELDEEIKPVLQDLIQELYEDNYHTLLIATV